MAATLAAATSDATEWPDYRGPERRGVYTGPALSVERMESGPSPLWRAQIGEGHSSVTVADGKVFVAGLRDGNQTVAALDVASGSEMWTHTWKSGYGFFRGLFSGVVGSGKGPRATPVWDDGRVFALGPGGELVCLDDETGTRVWGTNILDDGDAKNDIHGVAATPLVVDGAIVAFLGGKAKSLVLAYDKTNGDPLWSSLGGDGSYTSPMLAVLGGVRQIVVVTGDRVAGLAIEDGKPLWSAPWGSANAAAQPVVIGSHLFLSDTSGATLVTVDRDGDAFRAEIAWSSIAMKNNISSSVAVDGYIYGLDGSILACIDVETGTRQWKNGRFGRGQILRAGDDLLVLAESGEVVLVEANPEEYGELARFEAVSEKTFSAPALSDGKLFVRGGEWLVSYDVASEEPSLHH